MNAVHSAPHNCTHRGLALLVLHCASLDPDTRTARERLDTLIGAAFAHTLVFALGGAGSRERFAA